MAHLKNLEDCLTQQLKDLYSAEYQILANLTLLEQRATSRSLKQAAHAHLLATEGHLERLEDIGVLLNVSVSGQLCEAVRGLIDESKRIHDEHYENKALLDIVLIGVTQRAEAYAISSYENTHAIAVELGLDVVARLLEETLIEDRAAQSTFSAICFGEILPRANIPASGDDKEQRINGSALPKTQPRRPSLSTSRMLGFAGCLFLSQQGGLSPAQAEGAQRPIRVSPQYRTLDAAHRSARAHQTATSAERSHVTGTELGMLARIRRDIVTNATLSPKARRVSILLDQGKIHLRGPVQSLSEKDWLEKTSARASLGYVVINHLQIVPG